MMKHSAWRQMGEPGFWAGLLVVLCTLSMAVEVHQALKPPSMHSTVLKRHKRTWKWDKLYAFEEKPPSNPPEKLGRLTNTHFKEKVTRYVISGEGANDIFIVNDVGDILLNRTLDREKQNIYRLSASIINIQNGLRIDNEHDTEFEIVVNDINDNIPVFPPGLSGSISESSGSGSIVMTVHATDADDPTTQNGMVEYKLLNGTQHFHINSNNGVITTAHSALDREKQSQYLIAIQAKDMQGLATGNKATTIVTINITDINDNIASFKKGFYEFNVREDKAPGLIGPLEVEDRDEIQNKDPSFTIQHGFENMFDVKRSIERDGTLILKVPLDFEKTAKYKFDVNLVEKTVSTTPDNQGPGLIKRAVVQINVLDVDEPPVFNQTEYKFDVKEGPFKNPIIGRVSAKDPDKDQHGIRYFIEDPHCPVSVDPVQGYLSLKRELDREQESLYTFQVTAQEVVQNAPGQKSYALVNLKVLDINDNAPELTNGSYVYVCESDELGTIIGTIGAEDKDENPGRFRFTLAKKSSNFSLHDNLDNTASISLKQGGFSTDHSVEHVLEIEISDGGSPPQTSINPLHIKVCTCQSGRRAEYCMAYARTGVSVSALLAILLCILTILVIVILIVLRKRYQKDALVTMGKSSGEIHEQLVRYDEEGGGEMDTNGYDVSILTSACQDGSFQAVPGPSLYAMVKKPPACKGDMAVMIEVKKDEADHDRDGIPYDTLHIYGYEGSESLAGSLSSLDSSSTGSNLDYDLLHDWGPRFRTLAQLYGMDGSDSDESY